MQQEQQSWGSAHCPLQQTAAFLTPRRRAERQAAEPVLPGMIQSLSRFNGATLLTIGLRLVLPLGGRRQPSRQPQCWVTACLINACLPDKLLQRFYYYAQTSATSRA